MKETPPRGRLRRLGDEEIALWLTVARSVTPRPGARLPDATSPPPHKSAGGTSPAPAAAVAPVKPSQNPRSLPRLAPLERRLRQKLSRGQTEVEVAIDLHGMTQAEAHSALHHFLARAQGNGARLALVVTGKGEGKGKGNGKGARTNGEFGAGGVLRRAVPLWLNAPEWRGFVVGFEEASRPHGGAGALYVRLRRREKRGG